jgi:hypothetical protein
LPTANKEAVLSETIVRFSRWDAKKKVGSNARQCPMGIVDHFHIFDHPELENQRIPIALGSDACVR